MLHNIEVPKSKLKKNANFVGDKNKKDTTLLPAYKGEDGRQDNT